MSEEKRFHWRSSRSLDWQAGPNVKYATAQYSPPPTYLHVCLQYKEDILYNVYS